MHGLSVQIPLRKAKWYLWTSHYPSLESSSTQWNQLWYVRFHNSRTLMLLNISVKYTNKIEGSSTKLEGGIFFYIQSNSPPWWSILKAPIPVCGFIYLYRSFIIFMNNFYKVNILNIPASSIFPTTTILWDIIWISVCVKEVKFQ